jgi:hypothetical protein
MEDKKIIEYLEYVVEDLKDIKTIGSIELRNKRNDFLRAKIKILIEFLNK